MQSIAEVNKLDKYLYSFLITKGHSELKEICNKIINFKYVKGLEEYSKELLALAMEKRIVISIEKHRQKSQNSSYWQHLKVEAPLINKDNDYLSGYLDLAIRDIKNPIPKSYPFDDIKKFYDKKIYESSKLFVNRLIKLPNGQKISVRDLFIAINDTINIPGITQKNYKIISKKGNLKNTAAITSLIAMLSISLVYNKENLEQLLPNNEGHNIENEISNLSKNISLDIFDNANTIIDECPSIFVGYSNECPKEYQMYMKEMADKYNIPFNLFITIVDNESNGLFNTNGIISEWEDYGLCQINKINHDTILKDLGFTSKELQNDPYKNIEAAAYLINKICNIHQEDVSKENYANVFGTYNGWLDWKEKETSLDYVTKAMEKLNTIYNKNETELYIKINGEENARTK